MKQKEETISSKVRTSLDFIRDRIKTRAKIAVILGSGLGEFADSLAEAQTIETSAVPSYPLPTVQGHHGRLVFGKIGKTPLCVLQGRVHYYETGILDPVIYPIRILKGLGIKNLIVTNAAGGVNRQFMPADLMLLTDQINLTFKNPLTGINAAESQGQLYDLDLQKVIIQVGVEKKIGIQTGVYCGLQGPSYETAAEVEMIRRIGADAVGMSTVNEVSVASALGMKVAGISCITNLSTGISDRKLSHSDVTDVANMVRHSFGELLRGVIQKIG